VARIQTARPAIVAEQPRSGSTPREESKSWVFRGQNQAGCLDRCEEGPVCVVYPDGIWYTYIDETDVDEIINSHLVNGEPVERLKI